MNVPDDLGQLATMGTRYYYLAWETVNHRLFKVAFISIWCTVVVNMKGKCGPVYRSLHPVLTTSACAMYTNHPWLVIIT